jgi:hypothetical protein
MPVVSSATTNCEEIHRSQTRPTWFTSTRLQLKPLIHCNLERMVGARQDDLGPRGHRPVRERGSVCTLEEVGYDGCGQGAGVFRV